MKHGVLTPLGAALLFGCAGTTSTSSMGPAAPVTVLPETVIRGGDVAARLEEAERALDAEEYERAARLYRGIVDDASSGSDRQSALFGLGTALDLSGDQAGALAAYERYLAEVPAGADRDRAQVRSVRLLTYLERYGDAEARARQVELAGRAPLERVALLSARALGALSRGAEADAERDLGQAAAELDALDALRAEQPPLDVAAWAFARGELLRLRAARIVFDPLPADFTAALEARCQALLDAQSAYSDAMRAKSGHYSAMAGVRVAQLYQELHVDLLRMPMPAAADTAERKQLFEASLRLRYRVLLEKATTMLRHTLALVERTGEGERWAEQARSALAELEEAERKEERALAALPYTKAQLERALQDLGQKARSQGVTQSPGSSQNRPSGR